MDRSEKMWLATNYGIFDGESDESPQNLWGEKDPPIYGMNNIGDIIVECSLHPWDGVVVSSLPN